MIVLGIETSCDETAASIVTDAREVRSNVIFSQFKEHMPYGGVVPEIAARAHIRHLQPVIQEALEKADVSLSDVDAIAVTAGPGLIGGVIVGVMMAKAIALAAGKPLIAVNHLEGHALTARLTDDVEFPYLLLLASGGHCQFLSVEGVGKYTRLGGTLDDALGEAYDKTAKLLGLGMPGGPVVERFAASGDPHAHRFSIPLHGRAGCDMSFSGLKTAVRMAVERMGGASSLSQQQKNDICASFQFSAAESVAEKLENAMELFRRHREADLSCRSVTKAEGRGDPVLDCVAPLAMTSGNTLIIAGGVAANQYLKARMQQVADARGFRLVVPPPALCTDNAAMIAWAGLERLRLGKVDALDIQPRARWPLTELA